MAQYFHGNIFTCRTLNLRILFPMEDFISSICVLTIGIAYVSVTDLCLEVCVRVLGYSYHLTLAYSAYPYTRLISKCYMLFPPLFYHRNQFLDFPRFYIGIVLFNYGPITVFVRVFPWFQSQNKEVEALYAFQVLRNLVTLWDSFGKFTLKYKFFCSVTPLNVTIIYFINYDQSSHVFILFLLISQPQCQLAYAYLEYCFCVAN